MNSKQKIQSHISIINQILMGNSFHHDEDRVDLIRVSISNFYDQPFMKYLESVDDEYPVDEDLNIKSFSQYLKRV